MPLAIDRKLDRKMRDAIREFGYSCRRSGSVIRCHTVSIDTFIEIHPDHIVFSTVVPDTPSDYFHTPFSSFISELVKRFRDLNPGWSVEKTENGWRITVRVGVPSDPARLIDLVRTLARGKHTYLDTVKRSGRESEESSREVGREAERGSEEEVETLLSSAVRIYFDPDEYDVRVEEVEPEWRDEYYVHLFNCGEEIPSTFIDVYLPKIDRGLVEELKQALREYVENYPVYLDDSTLEKRRRLVQRLVDRIVEELRKRGYKPKIDFVEVERYWDEAHISVEP